MDNNLFYGPLPASIGNASRLQLLQLAPNSFSGIIPPQIGRLRNMTKLLLSNTAWSSRSWRLGVHDGTGKLLPATNFGPDCHFVGEVPIYGTFANASAFYVQGNGKLCGGIPDLHLPHCSYQFPKREHKPLVIPIVVPLIATLIILAFVFKLYQGHKTRKTRCPSTINIQDHPLISYSQLVKATDGFSETNLLGSGSFGSVYKGELEDQEGESTCLVAVKVLKLHAPKALKGFTAECQALRNTRHRNLLKVITVCSSIDTRGNDFKAIVYDFMANGSLEDWLHPKADDQTEQKYLNLIERVTILLDVAHALNYLHCHGPTPIVHCDLKSSNVLLDADMVAHVGDFGLAKILVDRSSPSEQSTSSMGIRGTIGYAAPGPSAGWQCSSQRAMEQRYGNEKQSSATKLILMGWAKGRRWADIIKPKSINTDPIFDNNKRTGS
ncbi:hypothetical protein PR202_gb13157 [Eleusine coracana subsp. coracana]|uniref:Protein kinase domain-containing protein n=1 Tax=Eleusine coracana subsp. coracana TaxID=191504 RepID=A0AAV5ERU9_ELECO|nr:hypothetical protein PR202_gb13157 [Eleusine coracana subsp. coracana]